MAIRWPDQATSCRFWVSDSHRDGEEATTVTLLLDAGVDIRKVQELLGHRNVTTRQVYDKRQRTVKQSASRDVPM